MVPNISTMHYAEWQYWWSHNPKLDAEAKDLIKEQFAAKLSQIIRPFTDVYEDDSFCCQGEGFRLMSENKINLITAAAEMQKYMHTYREFIKPL